MTVYQIQKLIESCYTKKDDVSNDAVNEILLKINRLSSKSNELQFIDERIKELKATGHSKLQAVCNIQYEFAKSKSRTYELLKSSGYYE